MRRRILPSVEQRFRRQFRIVTEYSPNLNEWQAWVEEKVGNLHDGHEWIETTISTLVGHHYGRTECEAFDKMFVPLERYIQDRLYQAEKKNSRRYYVSGQDAPRGCDG